MAMILILVSCLVFAMCVAEEAAAEEDAMPSQVYCHSGPYPASATDIVLCPDTHMCYKVRTSRGYSTLCTMCCIKLGGQ